MAFISEAVRYTHDTSFVSSVTTNYLNGYAAGTMIYLAINAPASVNWTSIAVSDNAGNSYTVIGTPTQDVPVNYQLVSYYCKLTNPVTTGTVITATVNGPNIAKWAIIANAFDAPNALDVQKAASGTTTAVDSGNVTPNSANQLLVGAMGFSDNGSNTVTPASGWNNSAKAMTGGSGPRSLVIGWRYVTSLTSRQYSGTLSSGQGWAASVAAFNLSGTPVATYTRSNRVVINATGSTSPTLTQNSGPTATIDSSGNPIFVITEPTPFNTSMSFTLTGTDGGQTATETIIVDPSGTDLSGRLVYDGTDWI